MSEGAIERQTAEFTGRIKAVLSSHGYNNNEDVQYLVDSVNALTRAEARFTKHSMKQEFEDFFHEVHRIKKQCRAYRDSLQDVEGSRKDQKRAQACQLILNRLDTIQRRAKKKTESQTAVLGAYLKRVRKQKNLRLKDIAEAADISISYVSKIEAGEMQSPSDECMIAIFEVLGLTVQELIEKGYLESTMFVTPKKRETTDLIEFLMVDHYTVNGSSLGADKRKALCNIVELVSTLNETNQSELDIALKVISEMRAFQQGRDVGMNHGLGQEKVI